MALPTNGSLINITYQTYGKTPLSSTMENGVKTRYLGPDYSWTLLLQTRRLLRRAGSPLGQSTYCDEYASFPCGSSARLTTRLHVLATNPHEQSGLGLYDLAVFHVDDAIGLSGKFLIVGDNHKRDSTRTI